MILGDGGRNRLVPGLFRCTASPMSLDVVCRQFMTGAVRRFRSERPCIPTAFRSGLLAPRARRASLRTKWLAGRVDRRGLADHYQHRPRPETFPIPLGLPMIDVGIARHPATTTTSHTSGFAAGCRRRSPGHDCSPARTLPTRGSATTPPGDLYTASRGAVESRYRIVGAPRARLLIPDGVASAHDRRGQ